MYIKKQDLHPDDWICNTTLTLLPGGFWDTNFCAGCRVQYSEIHYFCPHTWWSSGKIIEDIVIKKLGWPEWPGPGRIQGFRGIIIGKVDFFLLPADSGEFGKDYKS